jgi:hypothetical protein
VKSWPLIGVAAGSMVLALPLGIVLLLTPAPSASACPVNVPAGKLSQAEISALWTAEGGSAASTNVSGLGPVPDPIIAGAVGMAESGGDPTIVNSIGAGGLMQIHPPEPNYLDPATNMHIAVRKFNAGGWQPWQAFTGPDGHGDDGPWRQWLGKAGTSTTPADAAVCDTTAVPGGSRQLPQRGRWLASVPGMPGIQCDARIVPDVVELIRRYHVRVTACYAPTGHAADGEHPLGVATDLIPGPGGTWDDVDRLARDVGWTRPCGPSGVRPACPLKPWLRFVGYDGYAGHGRGNHLHLSWMHGPGRPATTVTVFPTDGSGT